MENSGIRKISHAGKAEEKACMSDRIKTAFYGVLRRIIIFICIVMLIVADLLGLMYAMSSNQQALSDSVGMVKDEMSAKINIVETAAAGIDSGTLLTEQQLRDYVDSIAALNDNISAVYTCYDDNVTYMSGGWVPPEGFVVTEREWYRGAQKNPDEVYISEPYVDEQTGEICITISKATRLNGKVNGVLGMDIYVDELMDMIGQSFKGTSYVFLTSAQGTILAHPNEAYKLTVENQSSVDDANHGRYKRIVSGEVDKQVLLDYKGGFKLASAATIDGVGWRLVSVNNFSILTGLFLLVAFLCLFNYLFSVWYVKRVVRKKVDLLFAPLESITGKVTQIADGNLEVTFDEPQNSMEIEKLTNSLNETIRSLKGYISRISDIVFSISNRDLSAEVKGDYKGSYVQIKESLNNILESLNKSFGQLKEEADILVRYSDELSKTTEVVANSATLQNQAVISVTQDMTNLADQAKSITETAGNVSAMADETNKHLYVGSDKMKQLLTAIESIENCYQEIAKFVVEINNIAAQTNLLSLNASIEAARAGEAGRGFSVVAGEISSLAASSAEASRNINKLIQDSLDAVNMGKELAASTSDTIEKGVSDSSRSKESINEIVNIVNMQQKAIESMNANLKEIASMVENNAASAQENQAICTQLNESAQTLKDTADSFKLK